MQYAPICYKKFMKCMEKLSVVVEQKVTKMLPDRFRLVQNC